jgi:glycosyltransferase involved in cell wall biosynthesis
MRILFVNHTSTVSGGEQGLLRLVNGLKTAHEVAVACPDGELAGMVQAAGVERLAVHAFEASLRMHPLQTPLGLGHLAAAGIALRRLTRRVRPDLLHANTPRAGLMCAPARLAGGPPLVVHLRDDLPRSGAGRAVHFALGRSADAVIAVSRYTAARFNAGLDRPLATHVYNSIDLERFDPDRVQPGPIREELGIAPDAALLGQISQITPWKGQATAIRAVAQLRRDGLDAHLLIVGKVTFSGPGVRYDNRAYLDSLHGLVERLGVSEAVHFLGQRSDVPQILAALDLSLLPSANEPFGRVTVESMAMGTPPLVCEAGSGPELVEDRVSGRTLPLEPAAAWAEAARELLTDRAGLARMGARARAGAARFSDAAQTRDVLAVYARVTGRPVGADEPAKAVSWQA